MALSAFSIVTNGGLVDERWRWTIAKWYACKTEPKKWKNTADMKLKNEVVSASINSWQQFFSTAASLCMHFQRHALNVTARNDGNIIFSSPRM